MSKERSSPPVKFFVGFITNEITLIEKARAILEKRFGPVDCQSDTLDFNFTTYYKAELGSNLKRRFVSFKKLISIEKAHALKLLTNKLEKKFGAQGRRKINIDPGYISLSKVILFTTKDFYHRIYLGRGIYAEVTLRYKDKRFQPFEWTYPDYRSLEYIEFFNRVRDKYMTQVRSLKC